MNTTPRGRVPWRLLAAAVPLALLAASCTDLKGPTIPAAGEPTPEVPAGPPFFEDVTDASGVKITYRNGEEAGHFAILESLGGGLALVDYDGDGLLDLFITGGGYYEGPNKKQIKGHPCKLYKNLGKFRFKDVTAEAGLERPWFYTHGAAVADFDRDGWPDLLVTGWGRMALYHNEPADPRDPAKGRKFVEVTDKAKLPSGLWTTSAAWGDLDGDGYPDLYVCQYVDWGFTPPLQHPLFCTYDGGKTRDVCPPKQFRGLPHKLFRNNGDGTFEDASAEAGLRVPRAPEDYGKFFGKFLAVPMSKKPDENETAAKNAVENLRRGCTEGETRYGKGLGVLMVDVNGDGKPDIYVANDTVDNFLYMNRTKERGRLLFEEKGLETGTARDGDGTPQGSMGVDAGDPFGLGRASLWVTNYENELHALYKNDCSDRGEYFLFATKPSGLAAWGQEMVGWGTGFLDLDHHGWEDLFFTTGHAIRFPPKIPRAQHSWLFRNTGHGTFSNFRPRGGSYFQAQHVGRGAVLGDLDNDGKIDLVVSHMNEPVAVLRNVADTGNNHWLGVELARPKNADLVGARVVMEVAGRQQTRFAKGGGSYLSSGDRRHVFGLGPNKGEDLKLKVVWPSGKEQEYKIPAVDKYWRLVEGTEAPQEVMRK
jgi:hypothetical protein